MHHKFARFAQYAFASMVPLTIIAFIIAKASHNIDIKDKFSQVNVFDILGLLITTAGVIITNMYEPKTQKVCIQEDDTMKEDGDF